MFLPDISISYIIHLIIVFLEGLIPRSLCFIDIFIVISQSDVEINEIKYTSTYSCICYHSQF